MGIVPTSSAILFQAARNCGNEPKTRKNLGQNVIPLKLHKIEKPKVPEEMEFPQIT